MPEGPERPGIDPVVIAKAVSGAVAEELERQRGQAWGEVRHRVMLAGFGFMILDLIVTLAVILLSGAHTRKVDTERAQFSCRNTALLASAFASNYANQQAQTKEILKTPDIPLTVYAPGAMEKNGKVVGMPLGIVYMPIFGFPPEQLKALTKAGTRGNVALLDSLRAIQHADCQGLIPPRLATKSDG